ncbi:FLOT1 protein, partial [Halcyon senegalensis]|nr:FLOT1 protein [Halcyon senegalensis]
QEIYKDRQKFSEQVFNVASSDLVNMGISVVSYTLKDIHDDQVTAARGHGDNDGVNRAGKALRSICWAGGTGGTWWGQGCQQGWQRSEEHLLGRWHWGHWGDMVGTRWGQGCQRGRQRCEEHLLGRTKQQIEEQRAQVLVVERAQQAQLQEHEIGRRERELEATVRKPAEAERYRLERLAEAQR